MRTELHRKGFTLIELLVVIAIIGILAAMLFPVFARARESARKTQCLANVKNIAMAFQIYLTDYDRFPPNEVDSNTIAALGARAGHTDHCTYAHLGNPYLRWPVILDEYIKSREIWKCPSALNPAYPMWIAPLNWVEVESTTSYCVCQGSYPPGWGGTVTDSMPGSSGCPIPAGQASGSVEMGLQMNESRNLGASVSVVDDATKYIIVADRGVQFGWDRIEQIAYPDVCRVSWDRKMCSACGKCEEGDNSSVGTCTIGKSQVDKWWSDASWRNKWTRHLGGSNIGFADGHAKWYAADAMIAGAGDWHDPNPGLTGIKCHCLPDNPNCNSWS